MDLIACLLSRFGSLLNPTLAELEAAFRRIPNLVTHIQPYVTEPKQLAYGRNVIFRNDHVELIVINLPPCSVTTIHDHGESIGCAKVIEGELINSIYQVCDINKATVIAKYKIAAGQILYSPPGIIHQMANLQKDRLVSIHAYSPPMQNLKVYQSFQEAALA